MFNLRIADFLSQQEEYDSLKLEIDRLNGATKEVSGNRHYRFVTFTANSDSSVREQLKNLRANPRHDQTARGGNFPQIIDSTLRKMIEPHQKVPEGMVTQYFCYVTNADKGKLITTCTFPKHLLVIDQRTSVTRDPNMLRWNSFHTGSITNYLGYLKTKLNMSYSKVCDDVEEYLMDDSLTVSGPEMAVSSVTNLNSNSGILISLIGPPLSEAKILNYTKPFLDRDTATIDAPMYCPECFAGLFKSLEEKIRTTTSLPEPLPPIGETSIPRTVYCTENKHKGHGKKDLLHFGAVHYKLNEFRVSLGASPHQAILVNIENKTLSKSLGRWVWIDP